MLYLELIFGLALLVIGGDLLVRGAVTLAARAGVSPLLIGLTVVGFGTSMPELTTSLQAAFDNAPGIAIGNVIGSNICNILLILGLAALMRPFAVSRGAFFRDGVALVMATLAACLVAAQSELTRFAGVMLLASLGIYLAVAYYGERRSAQGAAASEEVAPRSLPVSALLAAAGIGLTIIGAGFLVDGAIELAASWGVSESIIGLTIVAVGTSLPELVTSIVAALRRQGDIAFGNVVGSNIFNILGILGATALVRPIPIPADIAVTDLLTMLGATLALALFAVTGWRVSRAEGAALLAGYGAYIGYLAMVAG